MRYIVRLPGATSSGDYVRECTPLGFIYGPRDQAARVSKEQADRWRAILPQGPDFIVEPSDD